MSQIFNFEHVELSTIWQAFLSVWNFQVFTVDSNGVSFGKIVAGLVMLMFGALGSRRLSSYIERRFLTRLDVDASVRLNLKSLIFYLLLVFVTLFVLRLLNIPLTVFAVVGGALAIGVGFGSQNIVNNFISGLILMVERPIRVGDFIESDKLLGTIEQIGARSTKVKSGSNTTIVVPNSFFLEKVINNWTLNDRVIRYNFDVGLHYDNDSRKAGDILNHIIFAYDDICKVPPPEVTLASFEPERMVFNVSYSASMNGPKSSGQINTDLRHQILAEFKKADILMGDMTDRRGALVGP